MGRSIMNAGKFVSIIHHLSGPTADYPIKIKVDSPPLYDTLTGLFAELHRDLDELQTLTKQPILECDVPF